MKSLPKKCHSEHIKLCPTSKGLKIKVLVTFDHDEANAIIGLANELSDGCVAKFVHDTTVDALKLILEDLKDAATTGKIEEGHKPEHIGDGGGGTPTEASGSSLTA